MSGHDFFQHPILNSPYEEPLWHHVLDENGQPTSQEPENERRKSDRHISPVPKSKRAGAAAQASFDYADDDKYDPAWMINDIRQHVKSWRELPATADWGVTPATRRLLDHWRNHNFASIRPFFCQREAVETIIWLTEIVPGRPKQYGRILDHLQGGNKEANPELFRLAMKMATGAGKTTVMAMLIAWQTINAVQAPASKSYSKGFLIVTPGITIRDRLRVLNPVDPDSYYEKRELVPMDMLADITQAKVVVTNYHAFQQREKAKVSKGTRGAIEGWRQEKIVTAETEGEMLRRAVGDLFNMKNVVVINDEAHHCYREKAGTDEVAEFKGDDKEEAKENNKAARIWISGIEKLKAKIGVRAIYDLSATPFFLRGSGYREGTLFPWTVSDFSLMDAIECGIVKLPRVPILDNMPMADGEPIYRDIWKHIGKKMPKKGRAKSGGGNPEALAEVVPL
ncbi:MAG: DEAD/DEAH box helicase family protein, partial [Hyphomonadaceae bacterium]|nr:DEAD/DEAH box helicase family protein [Hyphomonadaceae bacterium]MBY0422761.1 DEAD/DEAH box helicase family protein [Parvularculaceae bacterium]